MRISDWSSDVCSSDLLSRDGSGTHGATGIGSCDRRPAPPREPPFRRDLRSRANRLSSPAMTNQIDYVLGDALPEPGTAVTVADGVRWVRMPLPFALNHVNLFLIDDGDGWVLVDCGLGDERSEEHTSELPSLMRSSYAVLCLTNKNIIIYTSRRE